MYSIKFSEIAKKDLNLLDRRYQNAVLKALDRLSQDPKSGEPLRRELKGYWKMRFSRYRIIYKIYQQQLIVMVMTIEHRKDVYRP